MTGVDIIGALLLAEPPLAAPGQIKAGALPDGISLTAYLVRLVSSVDRQKLKRVGWVRVADRVSVTVRAASYLDQTDAIVAVKARCAGKLGTIADAANVVVLSAGTGPDLLGPANSFEQTIDFKVQYDTPA